MAVRTIGQTDQCFVCVKFDHAAKNNEVLKGQTPSLKMFSLSS